MINRFKYLKASVALCSIILLGLALFTCTQLTTKKTGTSQKEFIGTEKCAACHREIFDSFMHTVHYNSSYTAGKGNFGGHFNPPQNSFAFSPQVKVLMQQSSEGYYQVGYVNGIEKIRKRMDIVVGSGHKGHSFLSWWGDTLTQLPITYFSPLAEWTNSPGYPGKAVFTRPITARCLECHTTFAQKISPDGTEPQRFSPSSLLLGVGCERCHGPGAQHIKMHEENPRMGKDTFIISGSGFSRSQQLDACAVCHGGHMQNTQPAFSFTAGNKLRDYFWWDTTAMAMFNADVHGNQLGFLKSSKCYTQSSSLSCNSCHAPHGDERGQLSVFSRRCISCHNGQQHRFCSFKNEQIIITDNCIDCHMPLQESRSVTVFRQGLDNPVSAMLRTHLVKIYPEEVKKFMLKQQK